MNEIMRKLTRFATVASLTFALAGNGFAGTAVKWKDLPEAVRATILANGGVEGQAVDRESGKKNGKTVYEAGIKNKNGYTQDLVITEDGKLVEIKKDDAGDRAVEQVAVAKKLLAGVKFSHPTQVDNPYLPLASLKQDVLEGNEGGKRIRIERTALPQKHKTFKIAGQTIQALVVEDREYEDGKLVEVAIDYFAQDDNGTVYYLGEDVDEYENGKIKGHSGTWMFGKDTRVPGILFPGHPRVGDKFKSEDVSAEINETDEVVSISETVTVPTGTYQNCVKIKEHLADGTVEYKYFAAGVGVIREVPPEGDVLLKSHTIRAK
jgi:hypothetical protein